MEARKDKQEQGQYEQRGQALEQELRNITRLYEETKVKLTEAEKQSAISQASSSQGSVTASEVRKIE